MHAGREMQAENLNAQVAAQVGIDLVRACCADGMMACLTPACCLHLQVDAALSAGQLRQSQQAAFQQKQWQWAYLLRMAMTFMPATLGRSDDLRKLPWSLALGRRIMSAQCPLWQSSLVACKGRL